MLRKLSKGLFPFLIAVTALSVSGSAAYYSVTGLSKLFAGAAFAVIIMAGSLEVAKLVIASLLHQYWKTMNKLLRAYLTLATVILILITSAGIYGFLSSAYQETANKAGIVENQIRLLETKKTSFQKIKDQYEVEKQSITQNITSLRNALGNNNQSYVDNNGNVVSYSSSANRRSFEKQLEVAIQKDEQLTAKVQTYNDSIINLETRIVETQNNSETASELGPLKYLSGLTGKPMDEIINILLLVIIFVFDPLAISLVVVANFAFKQAYKKEEEPKDYTMEEFSEEEIQQFYEDTSDFEEASLEDLPEEPYEIYVSGSDTENKDWEIVDEEKELLDTYDTDRDGKIDADERIAIENKIKTLQERKSDLIKNPNFSSWKKNKELQVLDQAIANLNNILTKYNKDDDDDLVIKYT